VADLVLVVEDDPANAVLVQAILSSVGGYDVICSDDGDEILEVIQNQPIVAVLMDVSLGGTRISGEKVDGVALTRRIRDLPEGINLPVILLTAHAMKGDRERLLFESSANDYVAKPIIDQKGLVELVGRHIKAAEAVRAELAARDASARPPDSGS
jgi:CheY-like chemotaxis protein